MSAAREEILARVRAALGDATPPQSEPRSYRRTTGAGLETLAERLLDYKADARCVPGGGLQAAIEELCDGKRVVVPPQLAAAWRPRGAVEDAGFSPRELDDLDGVLTGCTLAIAETGTLVLSGGPTEGRRALTLVPDLHICVVQEAQVVDSVPAAFDRLEKRVRRERRPLTFISGPSATSDIELSRVEGVHGPRRLVVLIVKETA